MATNNESMIRIGERDFPLSEVTFRQIRKGQGPSSTALLTAFLCAYPDSISGRPAIWVTFGIMGESGAFTGRAFAWIYGMRHESSNDESWNIDGVLAYARDGQKYEFNGYYNARTREGSLRVHDKI